MLPSSILLPLLLLSGSASASAAAGTSTRRTPVPRSYDTHTYYALELPEASDARSAAAAARALGVEVVEPLGELAGHWLVRRVGGERERALKRRSASASAAGTNVDPVVARFDSLKRGHARRAIGTPALRSIELLEPRQRTKRQWPPPGLAGLLDERPRDDSELLYIQNEVGLKDPLLSRQWHFANQYENEWELNVTRLWKQGVTGKGVNVVIVDDGLDMTHEDLKGNYFAEGSWDFNDHGPTPSPKLSDDQHGTRCAGEVAAAPNDVCGVGVSYEAGIAGVRILSGRITDADEASALNYEYQKNHIFSCSWGPPDDGRSMEAPDGVILKSMVNGVQKGRDGKGSLFVFAAGNGGMYGDQCNFDGYTNSIFSVTVGAFDHTGQHPAYSEQCSAMMVVAPSSGSGNHIHTTDVGPGRCASTHGGTSAAAPLMAGVLALALQVRPELTWRDVQHIAVNHAVMIHEDDATWEKTVAGRKYSNKYGYGRIDAHKYVDAARTWKLVKPQAWYDSPAQHLPYTPAPPKPKPEDEEVPSKRQGEPTTTEPAPIDEGSFITEEGVTATYEITQAMLDSSNFERLEHVTVRVWIKHERRGDVTISLKSPNGVVSVLANPRPLDESTMGFDGWKFMTLKHWDENAVGQWELTVKDDEHDETTGRLIKWSLQLWGEVADEKDVRLWHPAAVGEVDEEETGSKTSQRPARPKPTDLLPSEHGGELPSSLVSATGIVPAPSSDADGQHPAADEGVFDGIDGLRKHSTWLAGAFLIVLLAALGGGAFFLIRQRNRRNRLMGLSGGGRGAYAPVADEEVGMSLLQRGRRAFGGRRGAEESKELYDAFGDGPSDSEDDEDREGLGYHDDFLHDEDEHSPLASGSGTRRSGDVGAGASGSRSKPRTPVLADHEDGDATPPRSQSPAAGQSNTSSSSWTDAADDARRD